jgi:hypothetical protein
MSSIGGNSNFAHMHPDLMRLYKFKGSLNAFLDLVRQMTKKYSNDPVMLEYIQRARQLARPVNAKSREWKHAVTKVTIQEPLCYDKMRKGRNPFIRPCWRKVIGLVLQKLIQATSGEWLCNATSQSLMAHQIIHYEAAKMIALSQDTTPQRRRGLLIYSNTGSGKTTSCAGIMVAFWYKKLPNGSDIPIYLVTDKNNQRENSASKYAENFILYYPEESVSIFETAPFTPPRNLWTQQGKGQSFITPRGDRMTVKEWCSKIGGPHLAKRVQGIMNTDGNKTSEKNGLTFVQFSGIKIKKTNTTRHIDKVKDGAVCIIDEAHNLFKPSNRNPGDEGVALRVIREKMGKESYMKNSYCFLLTATPGDTASQVMGLLNLVRPVSQDTITAPEFVRDTGIIRGLLSYADIRGDKTVYGRLTKPKNQYVPMAPWYWFTYVYEGDFVEHKEARRLLSVLPGEISILENKISTFKKKLRNTGSKKKSDEKELEKMTKALDAKAKLLSKSEDLVDAEQKKSFNLNARPHMTEKFFDKDIQNGCFLTETQIEKTVKDKLTTAEKQQVARMTVRFSTEKADGKGMTRPKTYVLSEKMKTVAENAKRIQGCQYIYVKNKYIQRALITYMVSRHGYEEAPADTSNFTTRKLRVVGIPEGDSNAKDLFNSDKNRYGSYISVAVGTMYHGLNLFHLRAVHVVTPLASVGDDDQMVGRALRLCGHKKKESSVVLYRYYSTPPKSMADIYKRFVKKIGNGTQPLEKRVTFDKHLQHLVALHEHGINTHVYTDSQRRGGPMVEFLKCVQGQSIECEINTKRGGLLNAIQDKRVKCGRKTCKVPLGEDGELIIPEPTKRNTSVLNRPELTVIRKKRNLPNVSNNKIPVRKKQKATSV